MSENLFYFSNVCEKTGSKGFQYSKDSFCSKLFPSLNGNEKPRDFQNPMKIYDEIPKGFDRQLDLKNVNTEKLSQLLKIRLFINYRGKNSYVPLRRALHKPRRSQLESLTPKRPIHIVSQKIHSRR